MSYVPVGTGRSAQRISSSQAMDLKPSLIGLCSTAQFPSGPVGVTRLSQVWLDSDARKLLRFNGQLGEGVPSVGESLRHDADDTLKWAVDISDRDECEREYQR
jgi:hypothetical protein